MTNQISSLLLIVVTNEARSHIHWLIFTLALELFSERRVNVKRTSKIVIESEKCSFKFTSAKQTQEKKRKLKVNSEREMQIMRISDADHDLIPIDLI